MATQNISYGSTTVLTVTNLQSLASSATAGWQSDRIDNQTTTKAVDYEIFVKLTTANTAPGADKCMYIYVCPFYYDTINTTWYATDQGTTTLPTGTQGTTTIASPNSLLLGKILPYTTQQMVCQGIFFLSPLFGGQIPDGFSIIIINYSGAALSTSCKVDVKPINYTIT